MESLPDLLKGGMPMRKQSVLTTEQELKTKLDELYQLSKDNTVNGFEGLLEIVISEPTIVTAIHKIKANSGANTPGTDSKTIRNYLEKPAHELIVEIQEAIKMYNPGEIRRKYIPKKNGKMRPLGIPNAIDKIVQECVRTVIEPILEAKMFSHSYGFRPMRSQQNAIGHITATIFRTGYTWVVEGDIKGFFENVDHKILLNKLYGMGIHDKRVISIIKAMLKSGVMGECTVNEIGTPQGGIISPLLANVYLNSFDWYVSNSWETKKTKRQYSSRDSRMESLKSYTKLVPAYLIRYADDWVIITNTRANAILWKEKAKSFLQKELKLELSEDKTKITQVSRKPISFLGIKIKGNRNPAVQAYKNSYKTISWPDEDHLKDKMKEVTKLVRTLKHATYMGNAILTINKANAIIRGLNNYYCITTRVNIYMGKYACDYLQTAFEAARESKLLHPEWMPANQVTNYRELHKRYTTQIPAHKLGEGYIGITSPKFVVYKAARLKNQEETPYTEKGRELYSKRSKTKSILTRADEMLSISYAEYIARGMTNKIYNFEFYMNRAYAFNKDKGRCACCGKELQAHEVETHHTNPKLPLKEVNRVKYLATVCTRCHNLIHSKAKLDEYDKLMVKKITKFRKLLEN
jgi:group II intron reverse transcriptase/maturase